jgi:hypothetical protein
LLRENFFPNWFYFLRKKRKYQLFQNDH